MVSNSSDSWVESEFFFCNFSDIRLKKRFFQIMDNFIKIPSATIAKTFNGEWAETKGAYRFFENENVDIHEISRADTEQTLNRINKEKLVFAIEDTTFFNYSHHPNKKNLGPISRIRFREIEGIALHSTLAISGVGVPLGLIHQNIYRRETDELNHKLLPIDQKEGRSPLCWTKEGGRSKGI